MKKTNKLFLIIAFVFAGYSCDITDLDQLNSPNAVTAENADLDLYWNAIQVGFSGWWSGNQTPMSQVARIECMTWGSTYENAYTPSSFNGSWNYAYSGLVPDIDAMILMASEKESWIHVAAGKTLKGYILQMLVDKHGDVPYTEAWKGTENPQPNFDGQQSVYDVAAGLYDEALADLGKTAIGAPGVDIYYGSSAAKWTTLVNTLKFRMALNKGDGAGISAALAAGVIDAMSEDWKFQYGTNRSNPDSRHPWYGGAYESYSGPYLSNYFMWEMHEEKGIIDPRVRYLYKRQDLDASNEDLFTLDCVVTGTEPLWYRDPYVNAYGVTTSWPFCLGSNLVEADAFNAKGYWGRDHGNDDGTPPDGQKRTARGIYPGAGMYDDGNAATGVFGSGYGHTQRGGTTGGGGDGHMPMLMSSHVYFMRAEAAQDGLSSENARDMLEAGLRRSIEETMSYSAGWGTVGDLNGDGVGGIPEDRSINNYVNYVLNAYDAAADSEAKLNIIVKEFRLASMGNGVEPYNAMRRTGHPTEMQSSMKAASAGTFPRLFPYPSDVTNLNANAPVRTDLGEKVFWDRAGVLN
tara:strand:- start:1476 stop:3203 length:1728 start_codon:yes stop_codon:yes gene_type:complete